MPRKITISYRRDDSGVITGRIFDRLAAHFGRDAVFRDIDDIPPGVDFRKHISGILDDSDIVLAVVGPRWIGPRAGQSRLANAAAMGPSTRTVGALCRNGEQAIAAAIRAPSVTSAGAFCNTPARTPATRPVPPVVCTASLSGVSAPIRI